MNAYRTVPYRTVRMAAADLVGLTDVAEIATVTRQNMRKLMLAHVESFPLPVQAGSASLQPLGDVLT